MSEGFRTLWARLWMRFSGLSPTGRVATRLATWFAPPYKARHYLAWMNDKGFISPTATIYHDDLRLGRHVFIGDRVMIFQGKNGGSVEVGDGSNLFDDTLLETGEGGTIRVGRYSRIQRGCQLIAYKSHIQIGHDVGISQSCIFYPYNHGVAPDIPISKQPLQSKGPIVVDDHAWVGVGVIVLDGVRIGKGAVIGAGSVVTRDVPDGAIAVGIPARVVTTRGELFREKSASSTGAEP
jgi:acetyltransferase-like isoleucine patch superfamily enzyme